MNAKKMFMQVLIPGKPGFPSERSLQKIFPFALRTMLFWGLFGCSLLYQTLIRLRVALYRRKILRQAQLPCPVISVGNITTGGTGKTPTVIEIARVLSQHHKRVAVLSRGYQRDSATPIQVVTPDSDVAQAGDEPLLMAQKFSRDLRPPLPCPTVIVGSRRYRSGLMALERFQAEVMLLDDGFQHLQLARNCDLVLIDATHPFGGGYVLPSGLLREPLFQLRRADAFIITRSNEIANLQAIRQTLTRLKPAAPIFTAEHAFGGLRQFGGTRPVPAEELAQRRLLAVSGLGNPDSFRRLLKANDILPVESLDFPDHHRYVEKDGQKIARICKEQELDAVVTSEKDERKLQRWMEQRSVPGYVMMVTLAIHPEKEFQKMLFSYL